MDNRPWLMLIKRWLCEWFVAAALGISLDRWLNDDPTPIFQVGAISIALLVVAQLAVGLVSLLAGGLYLWLLRGQDLEMIVLSDIRRARVPPPGRWHDKRFSYLNVIANDDSAEPVDRVRAASLAGAYGIVIQRAGFIGGIAWSEAADKAVLRYAQESPEK